jgi:RNA polymerase sigma factor (sigma-70 family)
MPTYDYVCDNCGHKWELFQSIKAEAIKKCPECGKNKAKRIIGARMSETTIGIQSCLDRLRLGDPAARDELITVACRRLTILARKMFRDYDRLRQFEGSTDVAQDGIIRLHRALADVHPETVPEFFGLAALKMRQVLQDEVRHYFGRKGDDGDSDPRIPDCSPAHVASGFLNADASNQGNPQGADVTFDPAVLAQWTDFHRVIDSLPEKERQIVDLLFYHELTQADAAEVLGVDPSTVKRRWRSAGLKLNEMLKGALPGF